MLGATSNAGVRPTTSQDWRDWRGFWVDEMEQKHVVHKLYPFLGIANSLLFHEEPSLMRCGGGWINYAVQTDGYIIPCPTMWGMRDYYVGHIATEHPLKLKKFFVGKPCSRCDTLSLCGGRCLYANITRRWSDEQYTEVCNTVRGLVKAVEAQVPRIEKLIHDGRLNRKDLDFMKYNGCEIIP